MRASLSLIAALAACAGNSNSDDMPDGDVGGSAQPGGGVVGPTVTDFVPSGPIVVISGMTIEGLHITSVDGPCISGYGVSDVRITNNKIGPCAAGTEGVGVAFEGGSHDVRIDHNAFDDVSTAYYSVGDGNNNVFHHNMVTRVRGPFPRGQFAQGARARYWISRTQQPMLRAPLRTLCSSLVAVLWRCGGQATLAHRLRRRIHAVDEYCVEDQRHV